jgi:hypothetical protein
MSETEISEDELFLMANLRPADTGLPMVVWVSHRGQARHDVRVKVQQAHGPRMDPGNTASVAVRPTPHVVGGQLSAADLLAVSEWVRRNEAVIVDYWEGRIGTVELVQQLQPIPP